MMECLTSDIYDAALKVIKEVMLNIFIDIMHCNLPFKPINMLMEFVIILLCSALYMLVLKGH